MASGCPCSLEDRSRRVLMVRRLHPAVSMQSLLQTFGAFGSITGCKVFTHKSGRSAGCASLEFANHSTACNAYKELQGAQLNGKAIHLQWFDPTITSPSPSRPGQLADITGCSPGADAANNNSYMASRSSCSNGFAAAGQQHATPHRKMPPVSPHMAASPFGLLASSPHHNAYAGAAAQQQQQSAAVAAAALLAGGGMQLPRRPPQPPYHQQQQRQQLHRQASAPLSHAYNQPLPSPAGLHVPPSPHMSFGGAGFDALPSPAPGGPSDAGSMAAAAAAAAVANLSAAMAAGVPGRSQDSSSNLAALQLAAMHHHQQQQQHQQIQQQLACLALQQSGGGSHHDSPLSPARSLHQQQQQTLALAAALHSQQQQQQMLQHQLSGQLLSPGPTQQQQQQQQQRNVAQLHLARSMPNALGSSVGSSCSSFGSQGQLQNSAMDLMAAGLQQQQQLQAEHEAQQAAAAAGNAARAHASPFALSQPAAGSSEGAAAAEAAEAAAAAASSSNVEVDTVPPSASSLKGSKAYHAKKQLFREGEGPDVYDHSFSMLPGSSSSSHSRGCVSETGAGDAAAGGLPALAARWRVTDDTAAGDTDALAAAYAASSGAAAGTAHLHWSGHDQTLDTISPDLLAALQQMSAELDPCTSPLQHGSNAAGVAALQHQQLMAAVARSQALQQQQLLLDAHFSAPLASADAAYAAASSAGGSADDWATQMANMRARDVRASDSQVVLGAGGQRGDVMSSFRLSSPSLPGCYNSAAETAAAAAAQAWQHAAMPSNQQQVQQQRSSFSNLATAAAAATASPMPASQAFRDKHKQQLQLQLPDFDLVSAPMTSAQLTASTPFDQTFDQRFDQLITTEVMPDTPATAALQSPLDVQAAMLAAASSGPAASSALYGNNSSSGDVNGSNWVDWSSMAALLSPMQVPGLATRRFTDCSMPATSDYAGLLMQQEQQRLRQQHSRSAAGHAASMYGRHSSNILGAEPILPGLASLHEQQAAHSAAAGAGTIADCFGSSVAAFGLPSAPARCGDAFGAFGKTRHGSLCLDVTPQLLPFSSGQQQQQQLGANEAGSASSSANARFDSDAANTQASSGGGSSSSNAAMCHLKRGHLSEGGAGVGLYSSGSFTFKPPVLQQLLQESRLGSTGSGSSISGGGGSSSSSEALITEPFQMPSFFRSSQQQSGSSSGGGSGPDGSPTKAAAAAAVSVPLPCVSESGSLPQQRQQVDTTGQEGSNAEEDQEQGGQLESSELQEQQQQPSFTAPAPRMHPDAAAAAAAGAPEGSSSSPVKAQQQQQQQPVGGFEDVYRSLFGGEAVPSSV